MQRCEDNVAARLNGNALQPLSDVSVTVTDDHTGLPATLYSDNGTTQVFQPLKTDDNGYYGFYAANGEYTLTFSGIRIATFTRKIVLNDPDDNPVVTKADLAAGNGAALVSYGGQTLKETLDAPYVITGVANIKNAVWGAPVGGAEDPSAAAANAAAAQAMINSGARRVEFDDKQRRINSTLLIPTSMHINGAGRSIGGLVWTGGDAPMIARANYANVNAAGSGNIRLRGLLMQDKAASRVNTWTVDLTNGDSCGMEDCWIDIQGAGAASDKYGIALGTARGSTYTGLTFVAHIRNSRIASGKVLINTSDWYVSGSELWGNGRDHALMVSAGGTVCDGTQIVPGATSGIYLFNDSGFNVDVLKVADVYFDGSYNNISTGTGIKSAPGIGLVTSEINGCNFWHLNGSGIDLASATACKIDATFADCDSMGVGKADIIIAAMQSTDIKGRHLRNANAPKSGTARTLAPILQLTGQAGFPVNQVECLASYDSTYQPAVYTNPTAFKTPNGTTLTKISYGTYPDAAQFKGEIVSVGGAPRFSNGSAWFSITNSPV